MDGKKVSRKEKQELPPSGDGFWEGAEKHQIDTRDPEEVFDLPKKGHRWVQQGPFLVCKSCPVTHSTHIGIDKRLVGYDEDGEPIIEKREFAKSS